MWRKAHCLVLLWTFYHGYALEVNSPASIAGVYYHMDAHFGPRISNTFDPETLYPLVAASPDLGACTPLSSDDMEGKIALILRGPSLINDTLYSDDRHHCSFVQKVMAAQKAKALAVVIGNNVGNNEIMQMHNAHDIPPHIPSISVSHNTFYALYEQMQAGYSVIVRMNHKGMVQDDRFNATLERWVTGLLTVLILLAAVSLIAASMLSCQICFRHIRLIWRVRARRKRLNDSIPRFRYSSQRLISNQKEINIIGDGASSNDLEEIRSPSGDAIAIASALKSDGEEIENELMNNVAISDGDSYSLHNETCNICLEDFVDGEMIRVLRCKHGFHDKCIRTWIIEKGQCPICKRNAFENQGD